MVRRWFVVWGACALLGFALPAAGFHYNAAVGSTVYQYDGAFGQTPGNADTYFPLRFRADQDTAVGNFGLVGNAEYHKWLGQPGDGKRLYYGYLRWRSPGEWVELDAGRQYIAAGATVGYIDGGRLTVRQDRKWSADVIAGATVVPDFYKVRRFNATSAEEEAAYPYQYKDYQVLGARAGVNVDELASRFPFGLSLGASANVTHRAGIEARNVFGFDSSQDPFSRLKLIEEVQYDRIGGKVSYQYYAARYRPTDKLSSYVDYRRQEPRNIDYASLFWIFGPRPRDRARVGMQYKFAPQAQPFVEYALTKRGANQGDVYRAGLDQDFGYAFLEYGGYLGEGGRAFKGGDEMGAFASADFPKPVPAFEPLSLGLSADWRKYKPYSDTDDLGDSAFLADVHGSLKLWRYLTTTLGADWLTNPDVANDIRAYVQIGLAVSG